MLGNQYFAVYGYDGIDDIVLLKYLYDDYMRQKVCTIDNIIDIKSERGPKY